MKKYSRSDRKHQVIISLRTQRNNGSMRCLNKDLLLYRFTYLLSCCRIVVRTCFSNDGLVRFDNGLFHRFSKALYPRVPDYCPTCIGN